jgi:hypothetical protein
MEAHMSSETITVGEFLYEVTANFTQVTDYGVSMESLMGGQAPPPEGARVDFTFEGAVRGPKISGTIAGVDYGYVRADGRSELHFHATITTDDGGRIAVLGEGIAILEAGAPIGQLRENITLTTSFPAYAWVNQLQVWAQGTTDLVKGEIKVKAYAA